MKEQMTDLQRTNKLVGERVEEILNNIQYGQTVDILICFDTEDFPTITYKIREAVPSPEKETKSKNEGLFKH